MSLSYQRKVIQTGMSEGITIPKKIREQLSINKGDHVLVTIQKIKFEVINDEVNIND